MTTFSTYSQAELGYVQSDEVSSQGIPTHTLPSQLKLAWVVSEKGEKTYIDADDGRVIGDEQMKQAVASHVSVKQGQRPIAEYLNPVPLHQAILYATAVSIYGQHINGTELAWNAKPFAILSDNSHPELFRSLKSTSHFGVFGIKSMPKYLFVFTLPNHPPQGYIYNGYLSRMNALGEAASTPNSFSVWLMRH